MTGELSAPASESPLVALDYLDWLARLNPEKAPASIAERRLPSDKEYRALVEEAALGYFTEAELQTRFSLPLALFEAIREHPTFKRDVLRVQREQDGSEEAMRTLARREIRRAVPELAGIVSNKKMKELSDAVVPDGESVDETLASIPTVANRIKAVEQLRHIAGLGAQTQAAGAAGGPGLMLVTNLNLDTNLSQPGRYTIEAKPGRIIEQQPADEDFSDLLGAT